MMIMYRFLPIENKNVIYQSTNKTKNSEVLKRTSLVENQTSFEKSSHLKLRMDGVFYWILEEKKRGRGSSVDKAIPGGRDIPTTWALLLLYK